MAAWGFRLLLERQDKQPDPPFLSHPTFLFPGEGEGEKRQEKAMELYHLAAQRSSPEANFHLSSYYSGEGGVEVNKSLAAANIRIATGLGCDEAQYILPWQRTRMLSHRPLRPRKRRSNEEVPFCSQQDHSEAILRLGEEQKRIQRQRQICFVVLRMRKASLWLFSYWANCLRKEKEWRRMPMKHRDSSRKLWPAMCRMHSIGFDNCIEGEKDGKGLLRRW